MIFLFQNPASPKNASTWIYKSRGEEIRYNQCAKNQGLLNGELKKPETRSNQFENEKTGKLQIRGEIKLKRQGKTLQEREGAETFNGLRALFSK